MKLVLERRPVEHVEELIKELRCWRERRKQHYRTGKECRTLTMAIAYLEEYTELLEQADKKDLPLVVCEHKDLRGA